MVRYYNIIMNINKNNILNLLNNTYFKTFLSYDIYIDKIKYFKTLLIFFNKK